MSILPTGSVGGMPNMLESIVADIDRYVYMQPRHWVLHVISKQGLWAIIEYRFSHWVESSVHIPVIRQLLKAFCFVWHKAVECATGIDISPASDIGKGLYIGHFGGIIIGGGVVMGDHCNVSHGVTIGYSGRGDGVGCPVIGSRTYIATGAVVIGRIRVGDDVAIGANAVVTKDLPNCAVAVGVPARVISLRGSNEFVRYRGEADCVR